MPRNAAPHTTVTLHALHHYSACLCLFELCAGHVLAIELLGPHNAAPHTTITLHALHHPSGCFCCLNCAQEMCWPLNC
jgi:hypothetical protein